MLKMRKTTALNFSNENEENDVRDLAHFFEDETTVKTIWKGFSASTLSAM
jgi:hypothetical protein